MKRVCELKMRNEEDAKAFGLGTVRRVFQFTVIGNSTGGVHGGVHEGMTFGVEKVKLEVSPASQFKNINSSVLSLL